MISDVIKKSLQCRAFEMEAARAINRGDINIPTYLSFGTEHIAAILADVTPDWPIFAQHRCHSHYLARTLGPENVLKLIMELLGSDEGCNGGYGGSASVSIYDTVGKMFGHSGLLGDQVPIGVGYAFAKNTPTLIVLGDGAAEEDYVLGALGFAATHKCPALLVCEDNNLSILTEKKVRRSWSIVDVAKGFGINAINIPFCKRLEDYYKIINDAVTKRNPLPLLINVEVDRHCWHAGVGDIRAPRKDLLKEYIDNPAYDFKGYQNVMANLWDNAHKKVMYG